MPVSKSSSRPTVGRRERNKQEKFDRIMAAATTLFADHGVNDVTTQQIADLADIGTGTLFLYARTKGELLLMVQNSKYARALEAGEADSANIDDPVGAIMAVLRPIVECNRSQVENGRTYLQEVVFGNPQEQHHAAALRIVAQTAQILADVFQRTGVAGGEEATVLTDLVQARMFLVMAVSGPDVAVGDVVGEIARSVEVLIDSRRRSGP
ncbi:TetR/AcrR family transcriptional regulator [Gordonia sp. TBRC 11910]|uniref:TetR/AcrR family transcriptional regulator n=1 Tax=Gordonia asplenii TaxID=2725283 RepID=A0A848KVR1_9ACTN|nr:TetR/AcrR family transcriptional regulator [Gordonia asplenii]NMO02756.1 TetR/AcrR family transcriptional regulator [Gordonia asplenii]